jgi:hypothetical protein
MTDRRELILLRVLAILQGLSGIAVAVRNRGELPTDMRPAAVLLDADEVARPSLPQQRGRLTLPPQFVDMSPEIYVVMDQREPKNERIGEDMNALRVAIVKAVMGDPDIHQLVGANGDIRYDGVATDMASGRSMEGQMRIRMTFTYVLVHSQL